MQLIQSMFLLYLLFFYVLFYLYLNLFLYFLVISAEQQSIKERRKCYFLFFTQSWLDHTMYNGGELDEGWEGINQTVQPTSGTR